MTVKLPNNLYKQAGGIYCITGENPNSNKVMNFKIGRADLFRTRLDQYHMCFPNGFWIVCILSVVDMPKDDWDNIAHAFKYAKSNKPFSDGKKGIVCLLERQIKSVLYKNGHEMVIGKGEVNTRIRSEWYRGTKEQMYQYFEQVRNYKDTKPLLMDVIYDTQNQIQIKPLNQYDIYALAYKNDMPMYKEGRNRGPGKRATKLPEHLRDKGFLFY